MKKTSKKKKMIYTPQHHIPIGEACKTAGGEYALRIKKPNCKEIETLSLGKLVTQIVQVAEDEQAETPDERDSQ